VSVKNKHVIDHGQACAAKKAQFWCSFYWITAHFLYNKFCAGFPFSVRNFW